MSVAHDHIKPHRQSPPTVNVSERLSHNQIGCSAVCNQTLSEEKTYRIQR